MVEDAFEWDIVLAPMGPDGLRGYEPLCHAVP